MTEPGSKGAVTRYAVAVLVGLLAGIGEVVTGPMSAVAVRLALGLPQHACPTTSTRVIVGATCLVALGFWLLVSVFVLVRLQRLDGRSARGAVLGGVIGAAVLMAIVRHPAVRALAWDLAVAFPRESLYGQRAFAFGAVSIGAVLGLMVGAVRHANALRRTSGVAGLGAART